MSNTLSNKPFAVNDSEKKTQISHKIIWDPSLKLKELGLLIKCLSFEKDVLFSRKDILPFCEDGTEAFDTTLRNLIRKGFIEKVRGRKTENQINTCFYYRLKGDKN